jgi:hypothetical protein
MPRNVIRKGTILALTLIHFREALEMDPENLSAADMIKRLEKESK